eukprot:TRINITY_DN428_c0_g1_i2.p1 TRINITY_DN428_c0_g1~~TRINITY_DN428_c0_g1_i2.p1  ORF type:complete len:185 (-),score=35.73 TRINITY_DN428_c0_g1_i2:56-610(-)
MALPYWTAIRLPSSDATVYYGLARACAVTTEQGHDYKSCGPYSYTDNKAGKQVHAANIILSVFLSFALLLLAFHAIWAQLVTLNMGTPPRSHTHQRLRALRCEEHVTAKLARVPRLVPGLAAVALVTCGLVIYSGLMYSLDDGEHTLPSYCFYLCMAVTLLLVLPASILFRLASYGEDYLLLPN